MDGKLMYKAREWATRLQQANGNNSYNESRKKKRFIDNDHMRKKIK